jgi:hypothetical protein
MLLHKNRDGFPVFRRHKFCDYLAADEIMDK